MVAGRLVHRGLRTFLIATAGFLPLALLAQAPARGAHASVPEPSWSKDIQGYWVALITENWRMRMVTPAKGDYAGIPVTAAAVTLADSWDPAADTARGQQCRSYGAAAIMMRPERLHITWQDSRQTLQMDIDAGTQTRVFHFGAGRAPPDMAPSWQGYSAAAWVSRATPGYGRAPPGTSYLQVTTTHMLPGYLRENGVPYSANAVLTEDYDLTEVSDEETYMVDTTSVRDTTYLEYPLLLSAIFKKQSDATGWAPTPCSATW